MEDFNSPFYPYKKVYPGYIGGRGIEDVPNLIARYLMDLPDANGYVPADDNNRPRVRLMKYLYYDGAHPLDEELPSPQEKLSLLWKGPTELHKLKWTHQEKQNRYRT